MIIKIKQKPSDKDRGFILVMTLMLIVFASIIVLGVSSFSIDRLVLNIVKINLSKSINSAFAGVHKTIYDYRFTDLSGNRGSINLTAAPVAIDAVNTYAIDATQAGLLMVDSTVSDTNNSGKLVRNTFLKNVAQTDDIWVDRVQVDWGVAAPELVEVKIGNKRVRNRNGWPGPVHEVDFVPDVRIKGDFPPDTKHLKITFNADASALNISVIIFMQDGTQKSTVIYPANGTDNTFTVVSTGEVVGSNIRRTVGLEYNGVTGRVDLFHEIANP